MLIQSINHVHTSNDGCSRFPGNQPNNLWCHKHLEIWIIEIKLCYVKKMKNTIVLSYPCLELYLPMLVQPSSFRKTHSAPMLSVFGIQVQRAYQSAYFWVSGFKHPVFRTWVTDYSNRTVLICTIHTKIYCKCEERIK